MSEEIETFASMFPTPPGEAQRAARVERAKKERRTQMTDKQLKRTAERTTQINFRCSPAFLANAKATAEAMTKAAARKISVADVLEDALTMYMQAHKVGRIDA